MTKYYEKDYVMPDGRVVKMIDTEAIRKRYQLEERHGDSIGSSAWVITGEYVNPGVDDETIKHELDLVLHGTFGGRFRKFDSSSFEYVAYSE